MKPHQQLPEVIFREYDIRGKVGADISIDEIYPLGMAIAAFFKQKNPELTTVALGMDGRVHSPEIKERLCQAFVSSGVDVLFIGVCHSPALYFAAWHLPVQAGVMITASHNPKEYNGLKICLGTESVWGDAIKTIYQLYQDGASISGAQKGSVTDHQELLPMYIDWLVEHFQHVRGITTKLIIDCGNGAGGTVIPDLVKKMAWPNVTVLYPEVDGTYPNHDADPVNSANMQDLKQAMVAECAELGIGLDGDADRMAPMTASGRLVSGDLLLGVFAQEISEQHSGAAVVCDIKSSRSLINHLDTIGIQPVLAPSGHSIVKDVMKKHHAPLAGELSCHFFFSDRYFGYDDGVYAMLRLLELLQKKSKTLDELLAVYPSMHTSQEFRIACKEDDKALIVRTVTDIFAQKDDALLLTIDGVRATMPYGWGLLRASNTQSVLSIRFESETHEGFEKIRSDFVLALAPFYTSADLATVFGTV